jgi:hypothetical protein
MYTIFRFRIFILLNILNRRMIQIANAGIDYTNSGGGKMISSNGELYVVIR